MTNLFQATRSAISRWLKDHSGFWLYAVILLVAMAAAYDSLIWRMGTYYDDWEGIFMYKQGFSALQIWNYFLRDRPFSSFVHILYNPIIGASAFGWHVLGLLLNWGAILLLVRTLLQLWPRRIMEAGWIGLLVALYPGMHRQFVVHTSMPHYTSMLLFSLSLFLMVKAAQSNSHRRLLITTSVLLAIMQVLIIEYFAALELIRIFILFHIFRPTASTWKEAALRAVRSWLPYGLVFAGFLVYHFGVLPAIQPVGVTPKHNLHVLVQLLTQQPVGTVLLYLQNVLQDVLYSALYAWTTPWVPLDLDIQARTVVFSWALGAVVAVICAVVMWSWEKKADPGQEPASPTFLTLFCVSALLLGGIPVWIIGNQAVKGTWADRFLFGQILGAVPLLVVGIVWLTGQSRRNVQNLVFAILLAGSISLQFRVATDYAAKWDRTRSYYWQLKWRAPSLQPGTFLVTTSAPVGGTDSYQVGLAVNTAFNPGYGKENVQYWWFNGPEDLWVSSLEKYHPASKINVTYRSLAFHSDMQHALPVIQDKSGGKCLQIIDPAYRDEPLLGASEQELFSIAHVNMILPKEKPLPQDVFGSEPPHTWCYYYQRADLARQFGQWDQVIRLWEQAGSSPSEFQYGPEYLPFIEAFARDGQWAKAADLTLKANTRTIEMSGFLCGTWARIMQITPASDAKSANWSRVQGVLLCPGT
jgi:hypothetical protein